MIDNYNEVYVKPKHNALRKILSKAGCQDFGDVIIDDICNVFGFPDTKEIKKE